ncbi:MAG: SGNH/GDSL hydrolase family protein [Phormidesmis sp.]
MSFSQKLTATLSSHLSTAAAVSIAPLIVLQSALASEAANFSQIYAFGDSLVDTGNAFALTTELIGTGVPPEPYFEGRFANGPIWIDYLSNDLNIPQTSFGFGGSFTSREASTQLGGPIPGLELPGLLTQVDEFTAQSTADPDALYVIWAGANDYVSGGVTNPQEPVSNIAEAVTALGSVGAQNFLLANQPDFGTLPVLNQPGVTPETRLAFNQAAELHNQGLAQAVEGLQAAGLNAEVLDANALIREAQAGNLGFENTTESCISNPSCVGSEEVQASTLFWDEIHPTSRAHAIVATAAREQLEGEMVSTPEPGVVLGLLLLGGLSASGLKRTLDA